MVDTLDAAVRSLRASGVRRETLTEALEACRREARRAARETTPMIAKKGRASYLGERSAGHMDPGALSSTLLLEALQQALRAVT